MWEKKRKSLVIAAGLLTAPAVTPPSYAEGVSVPVEGVARHLVRGEVSAPVVRWVDEPSLNTTEGIGPRSLGHIDITLPDPSGGEASGGLTEARTLLLSSSCSGDRQKELTFKYEGSLIDASGEGADEILFITGIPQMPDGWQNGLGPTSGEKGSEVVAAMDFNGVNVWSKTGKSVGEKISVSVTSHGSTPKRPGYYTATYCVQQLVM